MVAKIVEAARFPPEESVACSYRININGGQFFGSGNGYKNFMEKCESLASRYRNVLVTDITDFYNQIYLHRLNNILSGADEQLEVIANDIECFLGRLNDKVSKGIPVGPAASIVMAESLMIDIDQFIRNQNFEHTRYVDDIRIFGDSRTQLLDIQIKLTEYLYKLHRLTLSSAKTNILTSISFADKYLNHPNVVEQMAIHSALRNLTLDYNPYEFETEVDLEDLDRDTQVQLYAEVLKKLMDQMLELNSLDLGLV